MFKWLLIFLPFIAQAQVGEITELRGIGEVVRQDKTDSLTAELELGISSYDDVRTGNGRLAISFLDDSVLRLTEHSKIVIDDFVFDPNPSKSRLALNMASGTARFLTGALGRINKENISIRTPTATIAIRGTDFTTTVDEIGRSLIILLPNKDGSASGEITVETAASTVVLNQPFQATMTTVAESAPTRPVVLTGLTLGFIDNLLIISPRDEITEVVEEQSNTASNILDVDLLEETELDDNELENDELQEEIGRLDIDLLNVDFLVDLLEIIEVSVTEQAEAEEIAGVQIEGIIPGFDPQNQTYTFVEGEVLTIFRSVENTVDLELDKDGAYNIAILAAGKSLDITVNGGGENAIYINQSP
jgi:hypothetical protein|tara:strand:+ start:532 stop:1614 length:1083 start_codon:yes stop_codon:yes gene_type:complete